MVRKQISSCERLLINTKDIDKRNVIQRETLIFEISIRAVGILTKEIKIKNYYTSSI
jgi:hypothetical protein